MCQMQIYELIPPQLLKVFHIADWWILFYKQAMCRPLTTHFREFVWLYNSGCFFVFKHQVEHLEHIDIIAYLDLLTIQIAIFPFDW